MNENLIGRFVEECGVPVVAGEAREAFLNGPGVRVLFIAGDVNKRPEVGDLTVVLREMLRDFPDKVAVALSDRSEERLFREQFRVKVFPTMVFFHDGRPAGVIPGMKRWQEYTDLVRKLLGGRGASEVEVNPFLEAFIEAKRFTHF